MSAILDKDIAVLVASCDSYSDVWSLFFKLFHKEWPDCPHPVYFGSNTIGWDGPGVTTILVGPDQGWGKGLKAMLERLSEPYVLLFLDDYFFIGPVDRRGLEKAKAAFQATNAGYVLLTSPLRADSPVPGHPDVGFLAPGAPYRASLNAAIWRRETLLKILDPRETPWQFELIGSRRSDALEEPFLVYHRNVFNLDRDGVVRGLWCRSTLKRAAREGVAIDLGQRGVLPKKHEWVRFYSLPKKWILKALPWRVRFKIGDALRAMGWKKPVENRVTF